MHKLLLHAGANYMLILRILSVLLLVSCTALSVDKKDSLRSIYEKSLDPDAKFESGLNVLRSLTKPNEHAECIRLAGELNSLKTKNEQRKLGLVSLHTGYYHIRCFNNDSGIHYLNRALDLFPSSGYVKDRAEAIRGIGTCMLRRGEHDKAIERLLAGLEMTEKELLRGRKTDIAECELSILLDLGWSFVQLNEYKKALAYFKRGLGLALDYNLKNKMGRIQTNLGSVYYYRNDLDSALVHFKAALKAAEAVNDLVEIGNGYNNIGLIYQDLGNYPEALRYIQKSLALSESRKDEQGQCESMYNIGEVYVSMKDPLNAEVYFKRSLALAEKIGHKMQMKDAYNALSKLYAAQNKFQLAYDYSLRADTLKDSIFNEEKNRQITEMNTKYETEKKEQENSILKEKSRNQELENSRQRLVLLAVTGVAILLVALAFFIHRGYREKKRANVVLEGKNREIEEKSRIVEEQNKDIKDSIRYAKRLQEAILPSVAKFSEVFPDSFICFRPKDIVSGDFYWFERFGDQVFFAAADCTGHGVPGAFMSIMGNNLLNQALNEYALTRTDAILNSVNKGLAKALRTSGETGANVKDGMDIALCAVDLKKMKLQYSGAFNPCWVIRGQEVIELKPDKFPVGAGLSEEVKLFSLQEMDLQKGDRIYIFSDGYADQFGGPRGKKFKYSPMQQILKDLSSTPMAEQRKVLVQVHEEWKGRLEQVDDILVVGVRV